jgi:hypothetical protein
MLRSPRALLHAVVMAPLAAALLLMVVLSASGALAVGPFAPDQPRNLGEAIVLSDSGTAVWLLANGADPNAVYEIRPGLLSSDLDRHVHPLAAAAYTLDDQMVRVTQRFGARLAPDEARTVACWMTFKNREAVARMVAPPGWTAESCASGEVRK